eukprot:COSAG06_NODE_14195_length_1180_cov_1.427382_2_plen_186_part_00
MAEQPTLKLMYFNFPGKAGAIRMALNYCGLEFEDYRFKDDRSDFTEMKTDGTSPFGQAPMLQVGGAKPALAQSVAILRYVAKLAPASELYPADPLVAHAVDALCDQEKDFWTGQAVSKYTARFGFGALNEEANAPLLEQIRQTVTDEIKPRHLANVEAMMKAGGTQVRVVLLALLSVRVLRSGCH